MESHSSFRSDFLDGARTIVPLLPGAASIGLVTGVAATAVGLTPAQALAMSVFVFSPIVMLTSFHLLDIGAPLAIVVAASLVAGVRFSMLSLSLAPYLDRLSTRSKWAIAYFLVTPTYVVSIERFEADPAVRRDAFFFGASVPGWVTVQIALLVGLAFGSSVPASWQLGFVLPLAFIALLLRFLSDRPERIAVLVAGVIAVIGAGFPFGTGLLVAAIGGVAAGVLTRRREEA